MALDLVALGWVHRTPVVATFALLVAWCLAEAYARNSTWRQGAPRHPTNNLDRGTYPVIAVSISVGMTATLLAFVTGVGGYWPEGTLVGGAALVATGLTIRVWALTTLGKFFTMPITIRPDHEIVRAGPYRFLRHPAYTGGLLTAIGIPVALGAPVGFVATVAACLAAYVYRIGIEEAALVGRFGEQYREYARATWRLIPGVY